MEVFVMHKDAYRTFFFENAPERVIVDPSGMLHGLDRSVWGYVGTQQIFAKLIRTDPPVLLG